MREVTLADGRRVAVECLSCALVGRLIEPAGGIVYGSPHFHAHQDVAYPVPGLVIVAARRHYKALDEMTEEESLDFIHTVRLLRTAQRGALGVEAVYYFYNEDTTHHFHVWMVPRYEWMYEFGRSVESLRPALLHARERMSDPESAERVRRAAERLREYLASA
ncbi:MAG: diadenosine tetraphosphate hydrolase [Actinomycetota bacterium]|nr:diadenosine tetraphosphate hydrolase [Actinomycetota bacterium]